MCLGRSDKLSKKDKKLNIPLPKDTLKQSDISLTQNMVTSEAGFIRWIRISQADFTGTTVQFRDHCIIR